MSEALLVVDIQNDFLPGGALGVDRGEEIIPVVNRLSSVFASVVFTQDWHPADHISFAQHHEGKSPFDSVALDYGDQVLWPAHCVQQTHGAALADGLDTSKVQLILRKGYHRHIDSYSAFVEADRATDTGLAGYLRSRSIEHLYVCGLATDFCVAWTALDARACGFAVTVIEDACRAIDLDGSLAKAWDSMQQAGVNRLDSARVLALLSD